MKLKCKCGSTLFRRFYPCSGQWEQLLEAKDDGTVEVVESFTDNIRYRAEPKTIGCAQCHKRHPNPDYKAQLRA